MACFMPQLCCAVSPELLAIFPAPLIPELRWNGDLAAPRVLGNLRLRQESPETHTYESPL